MSWEIDLFSFAREDEGLMSVSIGVLMPLPLNGNGVGYTCSSLASGMADRDFRVMIVTPRSRWPLPTVEVVETLPSWARYLPYSWVRDRAAEGIERKFLRSVDKFKSRRAAYLWPDATINTVLELKRRGFLIFREQFNCHTGTAKEILDHAYERLGTAPRHGITDAMVQRETEISEALDYIFCPSQNVEDSLLENGVPAQKCLQSTYGWDPARLSGSHAALPPVAGITAIFIGAICVRKGAHLLLDYWAKSGIRGRLVLAGEMDPVIKEKCASLLARDDVIVFDFFKDVGALYRSADVFVFPSLEEGSPLVTYEACSSALPVLTTKMGAGRIVRHGREGFVLDPYDASGWIEALRRLAEDSEARKNMGVAASERAQQFMWPDVARRRRQQIMDCLAHDS